MGSLTFALICVIFAAAFAMILWMAFGGSNKDNNDEL